MLPGSSLEYHLVHLTTHASAPSTEQVVYWTRHTVINPPGQARVLNSFDSDQSAQVAVVVPEIINGSHLQLCRDGIKYSMKRSCENRRACARRRSAWEIDRSRRKRTMALHERGRKRGLLIVNPQYGALV